MTGPTPSRPHRGLTHQLTILTLTALTVAGCGGGGGGGGGGEPTTSPSDVSGDIVYERNRDPVTAEITPVLADSGSGFDAAEVDSPSVVVDGGRLAGDKFLLYYEATDATGAVSIGVVSSDEEDFVPLIVARTQAIAPGAPGSGFEFAATDPAVVVDKTIPFGTDGRYRMWFEGRSGPAGATSQIIHGTSADGVLWGNFANCTGLTPSFASVRVADPSVSIEGPTYKMWFEAVDTTLLSGSDGPGTIGYAESPDGVNWLLADAMGTTGAGAEPVFTKGSPGHFDSYSVNAPTVVIDETVPVGDPERYKMWYEGGDTEVDTQNTIGFVVSGDGLSWGDPLLPVLVPSSDSIVPLPFDSGDLEHPSAVIDDSFLASELGHFLLWYTGDGENGASPNRIGLVRGFAGP